MNNIDLVEGFHHDYLLAAETAGELFFKDKRINSITKVYDVMLAYDDIHYVARTFFPADWSRTKVLEEIVHSLHNLIKEPFLGENKLFTYEGTASNGIIITTLMNADAEIMSAFPSIESILE